MKKIIALLTLIVFAACLLCSCAQPIADGYNQNGTTKKELRVKAKEFTALLESLNADEVDKVEIYFGYKKQTFSTLDKAAITKWVKLLKKIKVTVIPYFMDIGVYGYDLNVYINGKKQYLAFIQDSNHISFGDDSCTMCRIDNYSDELRGEFAKLEMNMGFDLTTAHYRSMAPKF